MLCSWPTHPHSSVRAQLTHQHLGQGVPELLEEARLPSLFASTPISSRERVTVIIRELFVSFPLPGLSPSLDCEPPEPRARDSQDLGDTC